MCSWPFHVTNNFIESEVSIYYEKEIHFCHLAQTVQHIWDVLQYMEIERFHMTKRFVLVCGVFTSSPQTPAQRQVRVVNY